MHGQHDISAMHPTTEAAESPQSGKEKEETPRKRPDRNRPNNNFTEAMRFLAAATQHMAKQGIPVIDNFGTIRLYFRNFCKNTGLRGKQRDSVRRMIEAQLVDLNNKIKQ